MEGLMIIYQHPTWETVKKFDVNTLLNLRPWLSSLGFTINVQRLNRQNDKPLFNEYYCKIYFTVFLSFLLRFLCNYNNYSVFDLFNFLKKITIINLKNVE